MMTKAGAIASLIVFFSSILFLQMINPVSSSRTDDDPVMMIGSNGATTMNSNSSTPLHQDVSVCSYTALISTSCASPDVTRDNIYLQFGDNKGSKVTKSIQIYPKQKLKRCSTAKFNLIGNCIHQLCYVAVKRTGRGTHGWRPSEVLVYNSHSRITATYAKPLPNGIWMGEVYCVAAVGA